MKEKKRKSLFVVFAYFHGVNTPTIANFKLEKQIFKVSDHWLPKASMNKLQHFIG